MPFGEIRGEEWDLPGCDSEVEDGKVEPRPEVRGEIARSVFYMMHEYGIRITDDEALVLWEWNRSDPPDDVERWHNDRIEQLQGTRNPFIDDPSRADAMIFSAEAKSKCQ